MLSLSIYVVSILYLYGLTAQFFMILRPCGMLKSLEINDVDLYYDYCPMAKAYWVSEEGNIVNPYLGQAMPTCGSVKDTLKAYR